MFKHPLQNRTNVQIKGGGGKGLLNNVQKKLHFSLGMASLITLINHKFFCLLLALVKDPCNGFEAEYCIAKEAPSTRFRYRLVG